MLAAAPRETHVTGLPEASSFGARTSLPTRTRDAPRHRPVRVPDQPLEEGRPICDVALRPRCETTLHQGGTQVERFVPARPPARVHRRLPAGVGLGAAVAGIAVLELQAHTVRC